MARLAGTVVFIGGLKVDGATSIPDPGVRQEYEFAKEAGAYLLPIGATGGMAAELATELRGSSLSCSGDNAVRPTDEELDRLFDGSATSAQIATLTKQILARAHRQVGSTIP